MIDSDRLIGQIVARVYFKRLKIDRLFVASRGFNLLICCSIALLIAVADLKLIA